MHEIAFLSIRALGERLRRREVSPVEVTREMLERMQSLDPVLNTTITSMPEAALAAAQQAEQEIVRGEYRGPLHGVPLGIKDLFGVLGYPTTFGSQILRTHMMEDATVIRLLRQAGSVLLAKQNLHEFAFGVTSENVHYGPVRNPWNTDCITGGSSGGTAAAIAAGLCYGGLGSDTGGSIRIPAAMCGVTGIKPTYGRVSCSGVLPLAWSLDHVGPLARTAEDCALLLQAIAGADPADPGSVARGVPDYTAELHRTDLQGVVLGVPREYFFTQLEPGVAEALSAALRQLEQLGARLQEVSLPTVERSREILGPIITSEAATWHEKWMEQRPQEYSPEILSRLRTAGDFTAVALVKAQRLQAQLGREFAQALTGCDALVAPTVPIPAVPIGQTDEPLFGHALPARARINRLTCPSNLTGLPAISLPCGFSGGLPVGLQLIGRAWGEVELLGMASVYQQCTDFHEWRPLIQ